MPEMQIKCACLSIRCTGCIQWNSLTELYIYSTIYPSLLLFCVLWPGFVWPFLFLLCTRFQLSLKFSVFLALFVHFCHHGDELLILNNSCWESCVAYPLCHPTHQRGGSLVRCSGELLLYIFVAKKSTALVVGLGGTCFTEALSGI